MVRKNRLRASALAHGILSATLFRCLVTLPICSARCAAQACLPDSSVSADSCHESTDDPGSTGWRNKASQNSCAAGEIVFTAPRLEERAISPKSSTAPNFLAPFTLNPAVPIGPLNANNLIPLNKAIQPGLLSSVPACPPLRI